MFRRPYRKKRAKRKNKKVEERGKEMKMTEVAVKNRSSNRSKKHAVEKKEL